jgi:hypothetical protein
LWQFRVDGDTARTREAFDVAVRANPYVVPYLLDPDSIPFARPPRFALRSREEAAYVAETLADAFAATDGALPWLAAQTRRSPSRPRSDPAKPIGLRWRGTIAHSQQKSLPVSQSSPPGRNRSPTVVHAKGFRTATPVGS